ncbi:MAG: site-specific integrase [Polyangiaceae bacterium]
MSSTYQRKDGVWCARVRTVDGRRVSVELHGVSDKEGADREASETVRVLRDQERQDTTSKAVVDGVPVSDWIDRWFRDRERRGLSSVEADEPRWSKWIAPALDGRTMESVSKLDVERIVESLDNAVIEGRCAWRTSRNAWALVTSAFRDACSSKVLSLRCRTDNPCVGVRGPDRGGKRSKAILLPSELLAFTRCQFIPLDFRRCVALMTYLGCRSGEARGLLWSHVDLEGRTVLVHEQVDRKGERRETKTRATRRLPIEPTLLPLLQAMHRESGGRGPVVTFELRKDAPKKFRAALRRAGVTRAELLAPPSKTRIPLRVHDLRGTTATWLSARGDPAFRVQAVLGHTTLTMTSEYVQAGEVLRASIGSQVFPALPPELLGQGPTVDTVGHEAGHDAPQPLEIVVGRQGLET